MPDHVHLILSPLIDEQQKEIISEDHESRVFRPVESTKSCARAGHVWQDARVVRASEGLDLKIAYVLENPVRAGLVASRELYKWSWAEEWAAEVSCPMQALLT
jgi:hypothetical protein